MTDSEKLNLIHYAIEFLADLWSRFFAPVGIDKTVTKNGRRVRVRVDEAEDDDALKRLQDLTSDRSQDA